MIPLLNGRDKTMYPVNRSPHFGNLNRTVLLNLDKLTEYYSSMETKVDNRRILVRMLKFKSVSSVTSLLELNILLDTILPIMLKQFNITSYHQLGRSNLIHIEAEDDYLNIVSYKKLNVVKLLYGDNLSSYLSMEHIHEKVPDDEVFGIDVRLLIIGYWLWSKDRKLSMMDTDPAIYVYQVVYTNAIRDRFNFGLSMLLLSKEASYTLSKDPIIATLDYSRYLELYVNDVRTIMRKVKMRPAVLLSTILLPGNVNALSHLATNFGYENNNNIIPIILVEATIYSKVYDVCKDCKRLDQWYKVNVNMIYRYLLTYRGGIRNMFIDTMLELLREEYMLKRKRW